VCFTLSQGIAQLGPLFDTPNWAMRASVIAQNAGQIFASARHTKVSFRSTMPITCCALVSFGLTPCNRQDDTAS